MSVLSIYGKTSIYKGAYIPREEITDCLLHRQKEFTIQCKEKYKTQREFRANFQYPIITINHIFLFHPQIASCALSTVDHR
ncbi:hypothetical protein EYC84_011003 [Monilinia fructicola]|uniref:Uncharacterized protein n=1 Tax=Monilinia fructicola TaxID=38448 RepID=A0A5M9JBN0_MONFR|nr:hypothetical protein EYC84_011003 [Monilinia fructicola]